MLFNFMLCCTRVRWNVPHDESNRTGIHKVLRGLWRIPLLVLYVQQPPLSLVVFYINFSDSVAKWYNKTYSQYK